MTKLSLRKWNEAYDDWLHKAVDDAFDAAKVVQYERGWDWLAECGYFMTMTFDQSKIRKEKAGRGLPYGDTSLEFDTFHGTYIDILEDLIGKRWDKGRRRNEWPLAIVGIDFEGSRYAGPTEFNNRNLHLHALWVVHPSTQRQFESLVWHADSLAKFQTYGPLDAIEFLRFESTSGDLSYVTKAETKTVASPSPNQTMRIYPDPNPKGRSVHWSLLNSYPAMSPMLKRMRFTLRKERIAERRHLDRYPHDLTEDIDF